MKYFTIQWWAGELEDQTAAFQAYDAYLAEVKNRLPGDLRRLQEDISLHDSQLRRLLISPEKKSVAIELDGYGPADGRPPYAPLRINLAYGRVAAFESLADPDTGLPGPHGYGDLGYDEIEILDSDLFQHRMLFSTGIEFTVTFADFTLTCERRGSLKS